MAKRGNSVFDFVQNIVDDTKSFVDDVIDRVDDVSDSAYRKVRSNGSGDDVASLKASIADLTTKLDELTAAQSKSETNA